MVSVWANVLLGRVGGCCRKHHGCCLLFDVHAPQQREVTGAIHRALCDSISRQRFPVMVLMLKAKGLRCALCGF